MFEDVILYVNIGILLLLVISIVIMILSRKYEIPEYHGVADMLAFALIIIGVIVGIDLYIGAQDLGYFFFEGISVSLLFTATYLVLIPLVAVLFLSAAISLRE